MFVAINRGRATLVVSEKQNEQTMSVVFIQRRMTTGNMTLGHNRHWRTLKSTFSRRGRMTCHRYLNVGDGIIADVAGKMMASVATN